MMNHLKTILPFLLLLSGAMMLSIGISNALKTPPPLPKPSAVEQMTITPSMARVIAQKHFPQGQIQSIQLQPIGDETYGYTVLISLSENERKQVTLHLTDGSIFSIQDAPSPTPHQIALPTLAQTIQDSYPAATFLSLSLKSEDDFPYYEALLLQDGYQLTLAYQPITGQILQQIEQPLPYDSPMASLAPSFTTMADVAVAKLDNCQLIALQSEPTNQCYIATYSDDVYQYQLTLTYDGQITQRRTLPLNPSLHNVLAPFE